MLRANFRLSVDVDFVAQRAGAAPNQKDKCDIEQKGGNHRLVCAGAVANNGADGLSTDLTANEYKHGDRSTHHEGINDVFPPLAFCQGGLSLVFGVYRVLFHRRQNHSNQGFNALKKVNISLILIDGAAISYGVLRQRRISVDF